MIFPKRLPHWHQLDAAGAQCARAGAAKAVISGGSSIEIPASTYFDQISSV
jgi:hypothetical protein